MSGYVPFDSIIPLSSIISSV